MLVEGDVSDVEVADRLVSTALGAYGRLDALVNNAGVLRDRTVVNMTPDEWDAVIRVHLRGHYAPTHAAVGHWKAHGGPGHIVCTASTSGLLGNFGQANYGAAKAGIAAFATIVAMETARLGVTCNAIAPAARTRMTEGAYGSIPGGDADGGFDFWHPDNVAPLVAYLCQRRVGTHQRQGLRRAGRRRRALPAVDVRRGRGQRRHPLGPGGAGRPHRRAVHRGRHRARRGEHDGQAPLHHDRPRLTRTVLLARLELDVRRDHPMTREELQAVRAAVRGGRSAPQPLRAPARALAEATLRSSDHGVAHPWLVYGLAVLALVNAFRAVRDADAPWAVPMAVLYSHARGGSLGRPPHPPAARRRGALAANDDPSAEPPSHSGTASRGLVGG